jgi:hypothetical protein
MIEKKVEGRKRDRLVERGRESGGEKKKKTKKGQMEFMFT